MQPLPVNEVPKSMAKRITYQMPARLQRELKTVRFMIEIFCRDKHDTPILCQSCTELFNYAEIRLELCRFQEDKPTCGNCPVHCYRKSKAKQIKEVMRYAGPKMSYKHPILAIHHILDGRKKVSLPT